MRRSRTLCLWCPDWPAVATAAARGLAPLDPVAVLAANRVVTANAVARAAGVRRDMRKRDAQTRCPNLALFAYDQEQAARMFDPVVSAVAAVVPVVEVLRPGIAVVPISGAARYFGSLAAAAEEIVDAVAAQGVEAQVGVADELTTAVIAARHRYIVPTGAGANFLAPLSIHELAHDPEIIDIDRNLVDLLWRMGIRTIGAFAELSATDVANRFGADAIRAHRAARALPERPPSGRAPDPDLGVYQELEPPVETVDAAAFAGRRLAALLHDLLVQREVACTRLTIAAETATGQRHERTWRSAGPLSAEATADRVRWQLDGWLNGRASTRPTSAIVRMWLVPVEVVGAQALQLALPSDESSGATAESAERAHRALTRIQGLLGGEAVQVPVVSGGVAAAEQLTWVTLGEHHTPARNPQQPWPGRLPSPAPALLTATPVQLLDAWNEPVVVTGRGVFTSEPDVVVQGRQRNPVQWWAGPWPSDDQWWEEKFWEDEDTRAPCARAQVLLTGDRALLLRYREGQWHIEGSYE